MSVDMADSMLSVMPVAIEVLMGSAGGMPEMEPEKLAAIQNTHGIMAGLRGGQEEGTY